MYTGGKLILVIADSSLDLDIISIFLKKENYVVHAHLSVTFDFITFAKNSPDLIIIDIDIEKTYAKDLCKYLKNQSSIREIPILCINALKDSQAVTRALEFGCDDFVTKPINPTELMIRIKTQLGIVLK